MTRPFARGVMTGQDAGDVFVGESVESIALDAFRRQGARDRERLGDRRVGAMESGVEAGDLRYGRE